jgi:hypothetical protein
MSHESVMAYVDACRRFEAAATHFQHLAGIVSGMARCLTGQARMEPYPPGMGPFSPGTDRIEVEPPAKIVWFEWQQWPTAELLRKAIEDYRQTAADAQRIYDQVPKEFQLGLKLPPNEVSI